MAYDLKKEEDVKEYLKNLHIEYQFGCYSEKKPEGEWNSRSNLTVRKDNVLLREQYATCWATITKR